MAQTPSPQQVNREKYRHMRLGDLLVETGLLTPEELKAALEEQRKRRGKKLGEILISMGLASEEAIFSTLALKFRMPFVNLEKYPINPAAVEEIPRSLIQRYHFLPINTDERTLTVAISNPTNTEIYDLLRFQVQKTIKEVLVTPSQLARGIEQVLGEGDSELGILTEDLGGELEEKEEEQINEDLLKREADEAPIVRLVNRIILQGIQKGASDIHLLPQAHGLVLAFRVDGDLREANVLDRRLQRRIISRIKLLAGMDIAEHRLPQDGRIWLRRAEKEVEIRISVIPNIFGESVVMRILDKDVAIDLRSLGFRPADYRRLLLLTQRSYGLILVTGPTGSGKSTTLFALLKEMIHRPLHIITIEDPVESKIPGVNQIQVNAKIGLTFARVLRNILRHDPDVIMVGEMRDLETASIGIEAALTGHLMLSTLHTNSATDTVTRLTDIGIPSYLLAPALLGIVSQNLVKRLCPACRREISRDAEIYSLLQEAGLSTEGPLYEAVGCQQCQETGYLGRVMLYEFLEVNDQLRTAIYKGLGGSALREVAVAQGMIPKMQHALELATQGIISHEDLIRVLI